MLTNGIQLGAALREHGWHPHRTASMRSASPRSNAWHETTGERGLLPQNLTFATTPHDNKMAIKCGNHAYRERTRELQDQHHRKVGLTSGLTRTGPKRVRLSRQQWRRKGEATPTGLHTARGRWSYVSTLYFGQGKRGRSYSDWPPLSSCDGITAPAPCVIQRLQGTSSSPEKSGSYAAPPFAYRRHGRKCGGSRPRPCEQTVTL